MKAAPRAVPILEHFSEEQLVMIRRLQKAMKADSPNEVVFTLAETALWALGLDPVGRESYDRLAEQVFSNVENGKMADQSLVDTVVNEPTFAGQEWIRLRRDAELEARRAS